MVALTTMAAGASVTIGGQTMYLSDYSGGGLTASSFIFAGTVAAVATLPTGETAVSVPLDDDDFLVPAGIMSGGGGGELHHDRLQDLGGPGFGSAFGLWDGIGPHSLPIDDEDANWNDLHNDYFFG